MTIPEPFLNAAHSSRDGHDLESAVHLALSVPALFAMVSCAHTS